MAHPHHPRQSQLSSSQSSSSSSPHHDKKNDLLLLPVAETNIPMFNKNGTALSAEEREAIAHKRGLCVSCFIKTADVKPGLFFKRIPLHTEHVYKGTCIRCHPNDVPPDVYLQWQTKFNKMGKKSSSKSNNPAAAAKFRAIARATTALAAGTPTFTTRTSEQTNSATSATSGSASSSSRSPMSANGSASFDHGTTSSGSRRRLVGDDSNLMIRRLHSFDIIGNSSNSGSGGSGTIRIGEDSQYSHQQQQQGGKRGSGGGGLQNTNYRLSTSFGEQSQRHHHQSDGGSFAGSSLSSLHSSGRQSLQGEQQQTRQQQQKPTVQKSNSLSSIILDGGEQQQSDHGNHSFSEDNTQITTSERSTRHDGTVLNSRLHNREGMMNFHTSTTPTSWRNYNHQANHSIESVIRDHDTTTAGGGGGDSTEDNILKQRLHRLLVNLDDGDEGVVLEIRDILNDCRNDSKILTVAMGALWRVTANDDDKKVDAGDCGAIDCILDSLRYSRTQQDAEVDEWAIGTLACLARGKDNRERIGNLNGVETILDTLELHQASAGVFEWSCRALHALVHQYQDEDDNSKAIQKNITSIIENDGVSVIVCATKKHYSDTVAQGWAMNLLLRLMDCEDLAVANQVLSQINKEDGIAALVKVLKARSTTPEVFSLAAELMANLVVEAHAAENSSALESAIECIPVVVRAMKSNARVENLQVSSCRLLSKLAMIESGRLQLKETKALEDIVNVMTSYMANLSLHEAGSWTLWSMSSSPSLFSFSVVKDALTALNMSTKKFPDAPLLLAGACGFIANIAITNEVCLPDIPVQILMRGLNMHHSVEMVEEQACRALTNVFTKMPEKVSKLLEGGGADAIVTRMESASPKVSAAACKVLATMAAISDESKQSLIDSGCLDGVVAMSRTLNSAVGLEEALDLIIVVLGWKKKKSVKVPKDSVSVIVDKLQSQCNTPGLLEKACDAVENLLLFAATGSTALKLDGLVLSMTSLIDERANPVEVKQAACTVLWALVTTQRTNNASDLSSMSTSVVAVMRAYKEEDQPFRYDLQSAAAGALECITGCFQETPLPIKFEDIDCVIAVMYLTMFDRERTELLEKLLSVLLNVSFVDNSSVIQCGGILVVVDAMVEHEQNEFIQELGCCTLALLASTENLVVNLSIVESDGIGVIISGLTSFPSNERIQAAACKSMSHLSVDQESRMLIASHGGTLSIVNAMNTNRENVDLLESACVALLNLSADADEQILEGAKVIETVIQMMRNNPDVSKLQEKGLGVLQNLSMRSSEAKREIAMLGGIDIILYAISGFMGSPEVLERAFTAMWSLALLDSNQEAIAHRGGVDLVLNGMMAQLNSPGVQKQACGCLCTLSSNSRNNSLIRDADGVDVIVYAMWTHYNSVAVLSEACRALSSIAVDLHTNEVIIAQDGEINAIIAAMRRFQNSAKLQQNACLALQNLLLSPDSVASVRYLADDIKVVVNAAAAQFPDECTDCRDQVLAQLS